jgi:hypothetical protein
MHWESSENSSEDSNDIECILCCENFKRPPMEKAGSNALRVGAGRTMNVQELATMKRIIHVPDVYLVLK